MPCAFDCSVTQYFSCNRNCYSLMPRGSEIKQAGELRNAEFAKALLRDNITLPPLLKCIQIVQITASHLPISLISLT